VAAPGQNRPVGLVIREARPEDAAGLAKAARDLGEQYAELEPDRFRIPDSDALVRWLESALRRSVPAHQLWLVAEWDGEAVGDAHAELLESVPDAAIQPGRDAGRRRVYLEYLAIQSEHRGHGIGSRLLSAVEDWAIRQGAELLVTDTNLRSNAGALEFYESNGFERQAVILRKGLS
jgi:GNAT superfamily N-acetyltransferase